MTLPRPRPNRGSISAFVVCSVLGLVSLAGLAFDGGRVVSAYVDISDAAQNAARMGDQFLVGIRDGRPRVDVTVGTGAVRSFLASRRLTGEVSVRGRAITVTVSQRVPMRILSLFGVTSRVITVSRTSELVEG